MEPIPLLLTLMVMGTITAIIYRFLHFHVAILVGSVVGGICLFALLLNTFFPLLETRVEPGGIVHAIGNTTIMETLGDIGWLFYLGLIWALTLFIIAFFYMKEDEPGNGPIVGPEGEPNEDEISIFPTPEEDPDSYIIQDQIHTYYFQGPNRPTTIEEATSQGHDDGIHEPNPLPARTDNAPPEGNYETQVRIRYMKAIQSEIHANLDRIRSRAQTYFKRLQELADRLMPRCYPIQAHEAYLNGVNILGKRNIREQNRAYIRANHEMEEFKKTAKLRPAQHIDWEHRYESRRLILIVALLVVVEFLLSWFVLQEGIGRAAITTSLGAIILAITCGIGIGWLIQYSQRNQPINVRLASVAGMILITFVYFFGFALLNGLRGDEAAQNTVWENFTSGLSAIQENFPAFIAAIINVGAWIILIVHAAKYFPKFAGYDRVRNNFDRSKKVWQDTENAFKSNVDDSLGGVDKQVASDTDIARVNARNLDDIEAKFAHLEDTFISHYEQYVKGEFTRIIQVYRNENKEARIEAVNPSPRYFQEPATLDIPAIVQEALADGHDKPACTPEMKEKAQEVMERTNTERQLWQQERPNLQSKMQVHAKETILAATEDREPQYDPDFTGNEHLV